MGRWAALLHETLNSEMELHRSFCADFGISAEELEATGPSPATLAYTGHLLRVANEGTIAEIAAALLPCQWGYDEIGRELVSGAATEGSLHRRWITGYNAPEYRAVTVWLKEFVDKWAADAGVEWRVRLQGLLAAGGRQALGVWCAAVCAAR